MIKEFLPKYKLFAAEIEKRISSGTFCPGTPLPSLQKLITANGVSRPTVEKGLEILAKRGLLKHYSGRGYLVADRKSPAVSTKIKHIAFISPLLDSDTNSYLKGIASALDPSKYTSSLFAAHANLEEYRRIIAHVIELNCDGIILYTTSDDYCSIDPAPLIDSGIPVVAIETGLSKLVCDRVHRSPWEQAEKIAQYMRKNKLSDPALILLSDLEDRVETYRSELRDAGIELPDDRIFVFDSPNGFGHHPDPCIDTEQQMTEMLKNGLSCKTLICGHDYPAIGALRAILKAGIKVPQEMKVISAIHCESNGLSPMYLTSFDGHSTRTAKLAARLLIKRIEGYSGPPELHYINGELIEGETT